MTRGNEHEVYSITARCAHRWQRFEHKPFSLQPSLAPVKRNQRVMLPRNKQNNMHLSSTVAAISCVNWFWRRVCQQRLQLLNAECRQGWASQPCSNYPDTRGSSMSSPYVSPIYLPSGRGWVSLNTNRSERAILCGYRIVEQKNNISVPCWHDESDPMT